jgi:predicted  nucleic acid-binding Zn-ribbon protein
MVAINDYELEIIELKKHIHQLEKHKDMHDDHLKLEVVKKPHHNIPAECEHLNKTELELEHEVKRLTRKIQAIEHDA